MKTIDYLLDTPGEDPIDLRCKTIAEAAQVSRSLRWMNVPVAILRRTSWTRTIGSTTVTISRTRRVA